MEVIAPPTRSEPFLSELCSNLSGDPIVTFKALDTSSLKEKFIHQMQADIFSGRLKPGMRLPAEREMALQFGISRGSVNQGVLDLERQGLLKVTPRRGTYVIDYRAKPTQETIGALMQYNAASLEPALFRDLMHTRKMIQRECLKTICSHCSAESLKKMEDSLCQMERGVDVAAHMYEFHQEFVHAAGNTVIDMIFRGFETTLLYLMQLYVTCSEADTNHAFLVYHRTLLDAIAAGEYAKADEALCSLLDLCEGVIVKKCLAYENVQTDLEQQDCLVE